MHHLFSTILFFLTLVLFSGCTSKKVEQINIAYIGPLSGTAIDLGVPAKNSIALSIKKYNATRNADQPEIIFHWADDNWEGYKAAHLYDSLNALHDLDIVFISNTEGTIALQDRVAKNKDILINPLNSDSLLSSMNKNTFTIAKKTEEANQIIGFRMIELGLKKNAVLYYPNDFMQRAARSVEEVIEHTNYTCTLIETQKGDSNFRDVLQRLKDENYESIAFFGYANFGHAMKQAREMGISVPFFGSTVLLDTNYYLNAQESIIGTECTYFNLADGNYPLAKEFISQFYKEYNRKPLSTWPALQAWDASEIILSFIRGVNQSEDFTDLTTYIQNSFEDLEFYQGVCGNISIDENGAAKGIYFSLYEYSGKNSLSKVRR
ncbi:ABC-type branched-chain amino acid transport system, substrate-binding protein [Lishizhenia tianjinensis]|uniref:ABC-type branched-chain amino acid transport system, substrate-binding protein n=1 Tax=Lishizhenia tianjinensis TaxID=477690 RepID=A0A1I6XF52_9FLAO|nr:ABC transporter substrate-binding protein [Lishizhenia tianjinensis]SFT36701.1 ABC-type branched-chain amino acid transport system, substrate-binding protein [Lishizhenia tianjinensis]